MDAIDLKLIDLLQREGRTSWVDLGKAVGMAGPSVYERVRKLEGAGILRGFTVRVDAVAAGVPLLAFIAVSQEGPAPVGQIAQALAAVPGVEECHSVTGDDSFLLKVRASAPSDLEQLVDRVRQIKGVRGTKTTVVLTTIAEHTPIALPLDAASNDGTTR